MRTVRKNVKPARVMCVFVAGEPDVALLCDEADDQDDHQRRYNSKAGEHCTPIFERIQYPNAFDLILTSVKG